MLLHSTVGIRWLRLLAGSCHRMCVPASSEKARRRWVVAPNVCACISSTLTGVWHSQCCVPSLTRVDASSILSSSSPTIFLDQMYFPMRVLIWALSSNFKAVLFLSIVWTLPKNPPHSASCPSQRWKTCAGYAPSLEIVIAYV